MTIENGGQVGSASVLEWMIELTVYPILRSFWRGKNEKKWEMKVEKGGGAATVIPSSWYRGGRKNHAWGREEREGRRDKQKKERQRSEWTEVAREALPIKELNTRGKGMDNWGKKIRKEGNYPLIPYLL